MSDAENFQTRPKVKLPKSALRLIEKNRQRRTGNRKSGIFHRDLEKTTAYLRWKAAYGTFSGAIEYVASELERERLYGLYRKIFPREWRKSRASFRQAEDNECHTDRELEFISLVSANYFPLGTWLDWSDYRFDHIPIEPINYDFCCDEYEWEHFRPCLQFAVLAFLWRESDEQEGNWTELLARFNIARETLPPIEDRPPLYSILMSGSEEPKIRRFLHLIEFIFHDSGNPFIDTTYCQPFEPYEWNLENLEKLKAEYEGVNEYFASMDALDEDIERDSHSAFKELITIWNTGRLLPVIRRQKEAADKRKSERGLLINILGIDENAPAAEEERTAFTF